MSKKHFHAVLHVIVECENEFEAQDLIAEGMQHLVGRSSIFDWVHAPKDGREETSPNEGIFQLPRKVKYEDWSVAQINRMRYGDGAVQATMPAKAPVRELDFGETDV